MNTVQKMLIVVSGLPGTGKTTAARALAAEHLALGQTVVADCVNPVQASREGFREGVRTRWSIGQGLL